MMKDESDKKWNFCHNIVFFVGIACIGAKFVLWSAIAESTITTYCIIKPYGSGIPIKHIGSKLIIIENQWLINHHRNLLLKKTCHPISSLPFPTCKCLCLNCHTIYVVGCADIIKFTFLPSHSFFSSSNLHSYFSLFNCLTSFSLLYKSPTPHA